MKKDLTRAELIEIGKKNEKPYGLMIKEYPQLDSIFKELNKKKQLDWFSYASWTSDLEWSLRSSDTFRINPDYQEQPQGIELEYCDVFDNDTCCFMYKNKRNYNVGIDLAIRFGAIGFMFEGNDSIYNSPIMYQDDEGHLSPNWFEDEILSGEVTPVRANKVVFIKERK